MGDDEQGECKRAWSCYALHSANLSLFTVVNAILAASRRLIQGPLPRGHYAPLAGERLQNAVSGVKQRWRAMGAF